MAELTCSAQFKATALPHMLSLANCKSRHALGRHEVGLIEQKGEIGEMVVTRQPPTGCAIKQACKRPIGWPKFAWR